MSAYYNEHDAQKAAWLRELMRRNLIAPGEVDERSVEVINPEELRGFAQCHFFAGIGVWSYALRNAGWADSSPVWTGSCPCPSFSTSGQGLGFSDPRHLWPTWFRLLRVVRPHVVFGEQVASDAALSWLDLVSSDLEGEGYAIGATDLCAAGVGAPHIRQRLYFVADAISNRAGRNARNGTSAKGSSSSAWRQDGNDTGDLPESRSTARNLAHPESERCGEAGGEHSRRPAQRISDASKPGIVVKSKRDRRRSGESGGEDASDARLPSKAHDFWRDVEWLPCRDGKARPVEPGTFPLAHGAPARVVRLRGYGDAIVAPLAQAFIEAYSEIRGAA